MRKVKQVKCVSWLFLLWQAELTFCAGDVITVFGEIDEDGFYYVSTKHLASLLVSDSEQFYICANLVMKFWSGRIHFEDSRSQNYVLFIFCEKCMKCLLCVLPRLKYEKLSLLFSTNKKQMLRQIEQIPKEHFCKKQSASWNSSLNLSELFEF